MLRRSGEIGKHNCSYPIFLLMEKNGVDGSRLSKTYGFESRPCREENVSRILQKTRFPFRILQSLRLGSEMAGVLAGSEF